MLAGTFALAMSFAGNDLVNFIGVTATEVNLARQSEGTEKFESSLTARLIVKSVSQLNKRVKRLMPSPVTNFINSRFVPVQLASKNDPDPPSFDMLRASVNLIISSALIAFGTSLKLPLSTTFVTFMVAMGTSLSDRAWDRDSAV